MYYVCVSEAGTGIILKTFIRRLSIHLCQWCSSIFQHSHSHSSAISVKHVSLYKFWTGHDTSHYDCTGSIICVNTTQMYPQVIPTTLRHGRIHSVDVRLVLVLDDFPLEFEGGRDQAGLGGPLLQAEGQGWGELEALKTGGQTTCRKLLQNSWNKE